MSSDENDAIFEREVSVESLCFTGMQIPFNSTQDDDSNDRETNEVEREVSVEPLYFTGMHADTLQSHIG